MPTGSAKVNRFGYGSEVEVKAGQLYAFRTVSRPVTHVGVGAARKADVLRVIWTNGIPQNKLSPPVKTLVTEVQQLKGSCPFLYAFDGRRWSFVTDALGAPAGLYDGTPHLPIRGSGSWFRETSCPGPDGRLLLDLTEELWETAISIWRVGSRRSPEGDADRPQREDGAAPVSGEDTLHDLPSLHAARDRRRGRDRTQEIAREDGTFLALRSRVTRESSSRTT